MPEGLKLSIHLAAPTELMPKPDDKRFAPVPERRCLWCRRLTHPSGTDVRVRGTPGAVGHDSG